MSALSQNLLGPTGEAGRSEVGYGGKYKPGDDGWNSRTKEEVAGVLAMLMVWLRLMIIKL